MNIVESEREKYAELWRDVPDYKNYSPGIENVARFMEIIEPSARESLIDIGCGTGLAGLEFQKAELLVNWLDVTCAGLDSAVPRKRFIQAPLWSNWHMPYGFDYGFCCDVMEHIPPEYTMLSLDRILSSCRLTWFQIALRPDQFGEAIGKPLHLTVQPFKWWLDHFNSLKCEVIDARDLCGEALYIVRSKQ
jgi:SAM-dependent methyltransferase